METNKNCWSGEDEIYNSHKQRHVSNISKKEKLAGNRPEPTKKEKTMGLKLLKWRKSMENITN